MKNLHGMSIPLLILLALGCSSGQSATSNPASDTNKTSSSASVNVPLLCRDWDTAQSGAYKVQNNVWGKGNLTGYSQCVGIGEGENGGVVARWTWDWLYSDTYVRGYPEIIFGRKPGHVTTTTALPRQIRDIGTANVSFNYSSTHSGRGNCAFEMWLSRGPEVVSDACKVEVMIWLDWYGGINPAGPFVRTSSIDGRDYDVFVGTVQSHPYIAFRVKSPVVGAGTLNLRAFLDDLKANRLVTDDNYVQSIEFGNEASTGSGDTILYSYSVEVR